MRSIHDNASKFLRLLAKRRSAYPEEIQVEVTNACNLQCAMCPHTQGAIPQKDFPIDLFEAMVRNNPAPKRLVLTGWGEPLMHRQLFDLIDLANRRWPTTQVRFTTNGILLNEERRKRLASLRVSGATVSIDLWPERGALPPEWRDILHPPSIKVFRNLIGYCDDRAIASKTPLTLQCLLTPVNRDDICQFVDFAAERSIREVNLVRMQVYPANPAPRLVWREEQQTIADLIRWGKKRGTLVRSVNRQPFVLQIATHFDGVCPRTDDSLYITTDGVITPCCNLRDYSIGALASAGGAIQNAWNSNAERAFFANQSPICGKCDALFYAYRA